MSHVEVGASADLNSCVLNSIVEDEFDDAARSSPSLDVALDGGWCR
jgi:hypothetical protein